MNDATTINGVRFEPCDIPSDAYQLGNPTCGWAGGGQIIVEGDPPAEGSPGWEGHNCDALGCGSRHVLMRRPIVDVFFDILTDGDAGVLLYRSDDSVEPDECDVERAGGELRDLVPEKTGEWYVVRLAGQFVDDGGFLAPVFDHVWTSASILPRGEAVERVFGGPTSGCASDGSEPCPYNDELGAADDSDYRDDDGPPTACDYCGASDGRGCSGCPAQLRADGGAS